MLRATQLELGECPGVAGPTGGVTGAYWRLPRSVDGLEVSHRTLRHLRDRRDAALPRGHEARVEHA